MISSSPSFRQRRHARQAFTLIELLTVITVIVILVGLIIGAAGYANTKAARSRAEAEIRALGTLLESYKADNGIYPRSANTDTLDARTQGNPSSSSSYPNASRDLFALLSGQVDASGAPVGAPAYPVPASAAGVRNYWGDLKPTMLGGLTSTSTSVTSINDPYGFSYGYSTAYAKGLEDNAAATPPVTTPPTKGYNPTFDLWSVANKSTTVQDTPSAPDNTIRPVWVKNW